LEEVTRWERAAVIMLMAVNAVLTKKYAIFRAFPIFPEIESLNVLTDLKYAKCLEWSLCKFMQMLAIIVFLLYFFLGARY
jgi:hypothetical protein